MLLHGWAKAALAAGVLSGGTCIRASAEDHFCRGGSAQPCNTNISFPAQATVKWFYVKAVSTAAVCRPWQMPAICQRQTLSGGYVDHDPPWLGRAASAHTKP